MELGLSQDSSMPRKGQRPLGLTTDYLDLRGPSSAASMRVGVLWAEANG